MGQQQCLVVAAAPCPHHCLCHRELAECRKAQQEENVDESRGRVQLAGIEAKHVSGCVGAVGRREAGLPIASLVLRPPLLGSTRAAVTGFPSPLVRSPVPCAVTLLSQPGSGAAARALPAACP